MTLKVDARPWGWMHVDGDEAFGPYDSKEAAIAAAREMFGIGEDEVFDLRIGRCNYAIPAQHVSLDMENLLEAMDQIALDTDYSFAEGPIFEVKPGMKHSAQVALDEALENWAARFVTSDMWFLADDQVETVGKKEA